MSTPQLVRHVVQRRLAGVPKAMPWVVAAIVSLIACVFVVMRGEDQNWDLLNYHYYSGYAVVNGRFADDVAPAGLQTYLHPLPNVLTFLVFSKLAFPFSSFALLAVQLLVMPALVLLGREVGKGLGHQEASISETLALALGLAAPMWWSELGTSFYSSTTASMVLFAVWFLIRGTADEGSNAALLRRTAAAGACMGLATALKLTNAIFLIAGSLALIPTLFRFGVRSAMMRALVYAIGALLGFAVLAWWYVLLYREFDSPVFPLFNRIFGSNYFDAINFRDARWTFGTLGELIRFPVVAAAGTTKTSEVEFADVRLLLCAGLALLAIADRMFVASSSGRARGIAPAMLLWFVGGGIGAWAFLLAYQRYLIPIELLLGLAAWVLLARGVESERRLVIRMAACLLIALFLMRIPDWGHHAADDRSSSNIFGLRLPEELTRQPAEYLVAGSPNGFVLAFLNPESHFYRIDFSTRVYGRIRERLDRLPNRRVKLITSASAPGAFEAARELGYERVGDCISFRSHVDSYLACDMRARPRAAVGGEQTDRQNSTRSP